MQYLLLIYTEEIDPATISAADREADLTAYRAFTSEVTERGFMRGGDALEPTATATTVRVREGRTLISDGPFAETKEVLGGYYLIDCPDLDTAIEMAAKIPERGPWLDRDPAGLGAAHVGRARCRHGRGRRRLRLRPTWPTAADERCPRGRRGSLPP